VDYVSLRAFQKYIHNTPHRRILGPARKTWGVEKEVPTGSKT